MTILVISYWRKLLVAMDVVVGDGNPFLDFNLSILFIFEPISE
jgi:hypothetical protein